MNKHLILQFCLFASLNLFTVFVKRQKISFVQITFYEEDTSRIDFLKHPLTQSQTIRKLKPTKRPSTPPMSATKELKGKASASSSTCTLSEENIGTSTTVPSRFAVSLG